MVVTADQSVRGGKVIELKRTVDAAVADCDCVKTVFVMSRTGVQVPWQDGRDVKLEEVSTVCILQLNFIKLLYSNFVMDTYMSHNFYCEYLGPVL